MAINRYQIGAGLKPSLRAACLMGVATLNLAATTAMAADIPIDGPQALAAALPQARNGDRLMLAAGDYGVLDIRNRFFGADADGAADGDEDSGGGLTIESANADDPAKFTAIELTDVTGLALDGLAVTFGPTTAPLTVRAINLRRVTDFSIRNSEIQSARDGDSFNDAFGIMAQDAQGLEITNCSFHDLFRGAVFLDSSNVTVRASEFHAIGSDGIAGGGVVGLVIEDNFFHDFVLADPVLYHPDAIQLWDKNVTRASNGVRIAGNVVLRRHGDATQGIFIRTPLLQTQNVEIVDNVIHQSLGQGIYLENASNALVANNTVAAFDAMTDRPGIDMRAPGDDVFARDNLATVYRMVDHVDQMANVTLSYDDPYGVDHGVGFAPTVLAAPFEREYARSHDFSRMTDVGAAAFTTAFDEPRTNSPTMPIFPIGLVDISVDDGALVQGDAPITLSGAPVGFGAEADTEYALFNGARGNDGGAYLTGRDAAAASTAMNLTVTARFRRTASASSWETLATIAKSWLIRMRGDRLQVVVYNRNGDVTRFLIPSAGLSDGAWHDLTVAYRGEAGDLSVAVDGVVIGTRVVPTGALARRPTNPLYIGGAPWHATFAGDLAQFSITR